MNKSQEKTNKYRRKKRMKRDRKIGLCLLWMSVHLMLSGILSAQDKVTFHYDAAGNRISRTIVLTPRSATAPATEEQPKVYTEKLADIQLKIYPNQTTGLVKVEIQNLPEGQTAEIWLYAMTGKLINTYKDISNAVSINISNEPAGIYVMKITAGEYRTEWKIIKK